MIKSIIVKLSLAAFALASSSAFACIPVTQADLPLTINQSGSYCVSEDLQSSGIRTTAITILADNVTLDLRGHILKGGMRGVLSRNDGVIIKNGTIANARVGVFIWGNSYGDRAKNNTIENISFANITHKVISVTHAKDAIILNNRVNLDLDGNNSNSGIAIDAVRTVGLHIKNNTISMNDRSGRKPGTAFASTQTRNVVIENNTFLGHGVVASSELRLFRLSNSGGMTIKNNNSSGISIFASTWATNVVVLIDNTILRSSLNAFPTNLNFIDGGGNQFFW